jgi:hypothetical protein
MEKQVEPTPVELDLRTGNAVKVYQKIVEGKKERIVAFQGKIVKSRGAGDNKMVTVRQFIDGLLTTGKNKYDCMLSFFSFFFKAYMHRTILSQIRNMLLFHIRIVGNLSMIGHPDGE